MLIDTHCHINNMVKKEFDIPLTPTELAAAKNIITQAAHADVTTIINVGTSYVESLNCIELAKTYPTIWATVGIHPNDLNENWQSELKELTKLLKHKTENKIVGIGECGMDFHYPDYNLQRQKDGFKAQIEMALEYDLALVVHTRQAPDETLRCIEEFKGQITRGIIHCFSENQSFADQVIEWGFAIGLGGIITYPKNEYLRSIGKNVPLDTIVLETDAPFLPIQSMRGKQNHPQYIRAIAEYLAELRSESLEHVAQTTTKTARRIFALK